MRTRNLAVLTSLVLLLTSTAAFAGGPLVVFDPSARTPFAYPAGPVNVYTDLGAMGPLTNAQADNLVANGAAAWTAVPTSYLDLVVAGDFSSVGLPDIVGANAGTVVANFNGGGIHVMYDNDGSIIANFFGAPPGVLGIGSPDFATGAVLDESWYVINGTSVDAGDLVPFPGASFGGVVTHENGHAINLAHTQCNGGIGFFGDDIQPTGCAAPYAGGPTFAQFETMYPFIDPSPGSVGIDMATVNMLDDIAALSDIYPSGWPIDGTITGTVFLSDGVSEITGVNVIARNVADPFGDCQSALSGDYTQGDLGPDGLYTFHGLTVNADYVVYVDEIVAGGFSTTPVNLPGPEEYWNAAESADPLVDDPCDYTAIVPVAGAPITADIIFTDPGPTLPLGDDDAIEVPLGFSFPFCDGSSYSSVFVGSNGFLTFGVGDTDFSESVGDLVGGPPRIAGWWDDLSPDSGGTVTAEPVGADFVVTFTDVPQFASSDGNSFRFTLRPDGSYSVEYFGIDSTDGIVGRSQGGGAVDPGSTDLSGQTQPLGFGQQTLYELVSGPWDLDGTTVEWVICEDLPPAILGVDPASFSFTVPVGGTDSGALTISNLATPPARDLEWSLNDNELISKMSASKLPIDLQLSTPATFDRPQWKPSALPEGMDPKSVLRQCEGCKEKRADAAARLRARAGSMKPDLTNGASAANAVTDGGFEAGPFGGTWVESSTNFGTPICDVGACGVGTGSGPNGGTFWAWFGGIGAYEEGSVSQSVTIPTGNVALTFYLEQIVCDSAADYLEVLIDGNQVFFTDGSSALCGVLGYQLQTVDISAYGDGGVHTLEFHSEIFANNLGGTNFFVDDVAIDALVPDCGWLTLAPTAGVTPAGGSTAVVLSVDAAGLPVGTYECEVAVSSNVGSATVPVSLNVVAGGDDPVALCEPVVMVTSFNPDPPCEADVDPSEVDNGSFDPDGGSVTLALDPVGPYPGGATAVTLIVTDDEGQVSTCESIIVIDCPVPVQMAPVQVQRQGWDAVLTWGVRRTEGLAGFHVYREDLGGSDRIQLTVEMLPKSDSYEFTDPIAPAGAANYWLEEVSVDGGTILHGPYVMGEGQAGPSVRMAPGQPNPFGGETTISYALREGRPVKLAVYDLRGRLVNTLIDGVQSAGVYQTAWDGRSATGESVAAGVYVMRLQAGDIVEQQKVTLMR